MMYLTKIAMFVVCLCFGIVGVATAQSPEEIHAKFIKEWLAHPKGQRKEFKTSETLPLLVPDSLRKTLRHRFEQRMALEGHGVLFDMNGSRVILKEGELIDLQEEMFEAAMKDATGNSALRRKPGDALEALIKDIRQISRAGKFDKAQRFVLRNAEIRALAYRMPDRFRDVYIWRTRFVRERWEELVRVHPNRDILTIDERTRAWILDWWISLQSTDYMKECKAGGVPVPPDFALSGTDWTKQGELTINMLSPGRDADVYTWASPDVEGGCIALPRYEANGDPDLAGILCQGAETGNACIWDSYLKGSNAKIDFAQETLVISEIKDATELTNCPYCHIGNNAFLIAPDDDVWCSVLRGQPDCADMTGLNRHNFTTTIADGIRTVNAGGVAHSRFSFLSGQPPKPSWANDAAANACAGSCHLAGDASMVIFQPQAPGDLPRRQKMEPLCGANCGD